VKTFGFFFEVDAFGEAARFFGVDAAEESERALDIRGGILSCRLRVMHRNV
jgi:hypothetical protein